MLSAVRSPHVDVIGHPTGRVVGGRDPADLDLEAVLAAAHETGVALEINSHPERLDLKDVHARRAVETGCLLAINVDPHGPADFSLREYGVATARRGWVRAQDVLNTWPLDRLLAWIGRRG
jgi:DNA polymerase (family 10)